MAVDDPPMPPVRPAPVARMTHAETDPCPGATRVGKLAAWQHSHGVSCSRCGRMGLRFAWWGPGHLCGRCKRDREDTDT